MQSNLNSTSAARTSGTPENHRNRHHPMLRHLLRLWRSTEVQAEAEPEVDPEHAPRMRSHYCDCFEPHIEMRQSAFHHHRRNRRMGHLLMSLSEAEVDPEHAPILLMRCDCIDLHSQMSQMSKGQSAFPYSQTFWSALPYSHTILKSYLIGPGLVGRSRGASFLEQMLHAIEITVGGLDGFVC